MAAAVLIRPATAADADAIGRVQVESWRAAYTGLMPDEVVAGFDVGERQADWRDGLGRPRRPRSEVLVAEVEGMVVGFVTVGLCRAEPGEDAADIGELYAIYVDPGYWGTGAGRALIAAAEETMRAFGFGEARLWVLDGNERAERFYRAAGWVRDGVKVDVFRGAEIPEARYSKTL